jgi:hypothetical protein
VKLDLRLIVPGPSMGTILLTTDGALAAWSKGELDQQRVATDAWIEAWAGPTGPTAVHEAIDDIQIAGAAYQVISYDGIIRALEPATRYTMADGASEYLALLEAILDRA